MAVHHEDDTTIDIQAVAFDLDGTLIDSNRALTPRTVQAVTALKERGVVPIIATGRSYRAMRSFKEQLRIDTPVICYNGATVFDGRNAEVLQETLLYDDVSREIIELGRMYGVHMHAFKQEELLFEQSSPEVEEYQRRIGFDGRLVDFDAMGQLHFTKMMYISEDQQAILPIAEQLERDFGSRLQHCFSLPIFYEMMDGAVSKHSALQFVLDDLGVDAGHVMAFGDGHNDISMLQGVGIGVAMANAREEVKACTPYSAPSNDADGVAVFLDSFFHLGIF